MLKAWNKNMVDQFTPSWVSCLDESMSTWMNKYTCPGWMFVPRKPWPIGNEYHTVCCSLSGIFWQLELVEGKDAPSTIILKFNIIAIYSYIFYLSFIQILQTLLWWMLMLYLWLLLVHYSCPEPVAVVYVAVPSSVLLKWPFAIACDQMVPPFA